MANPFSIEPVNPLQAILAGEQGYTTAHKRAKEQAEEDALARISPYLSKGDFSGALAAGQGANFPTLMGLVTAGQHAREQSPEYQRQKAEIAGEVGAKYRAPHFVQGPGDLLNPEEVPNVYSIPTAPGGGKATQVLGTPHPSIAPSSMPVPAGGMVTKPGEKIISAVPDSGPNAGRNIAETADTVPKELLRGEEYLATLPAGTAAFLRKVARYEINPATLSNKGGHREAVLKAVSQVDDTYDQALYPAKAAATKEFMAGGPTSPAGTMTSGNTAIQHLGRLYDISEKIGGTNNAWILNKPLNWLNANYLEFKNDPDIARYKGAMDRYVEEAVKFYRGVGGNEADIKRSIENLTTAQSPESRQAAIAEQANLIHSKINALSERLKATLTPGAWEQQAKKNPETVIVHEKSASEMRKMRGESVAPSATPAATPASKVPAIGEVRGGYRFKGGNPGEQSNWVPIK